MLFIVWKKEGFHVQETVLLLLKNSRESVSVSLCLEVFTGQGIRGMIS